MSEVKVTFTTDNERFRGNNLYKEEGYRAAYFTGLAHASLPEELQKHFQHFGVQILNYKHGPVTIRMSLIAWFPYKKNEGKDHQSEEFKRVVEYDAPIEMFKKDEQKTVSVKDIEFELLKLLETHIRQLEQEIVKASDEVHDQLCMVVGAQVVPMRLLSSNSK